MPHLHPERPIAVLAITRAGIVLAGEVVKALPGARLYAPQAMGVLAAAAAPGAFQCYNGPLRDLIPDLFDGCSGIIAICSLGAVVRLIAPHLRDKYRDPAVVVLDEAGRFAIPTLSGHLGGANALAGRIAQALGATAVLTTASDVRQTLAVDLLGRELGWTLEASSADLLRASAAVVNDEPVALVQEVGVTDWWLNHANGRTGPLPANLHCFGDLESIDLGRYRVLLWISDRAVPPMLTGYQGTLIIYRVGETQ